MLKKIIGLGIAGTAVGMVAAAATAHNLRRSLVPTTDPSADEIVAVAIFGLLEFHSTSRNFRGGRLECWYGGGVLDLRRTRCSRRKAPRSRSAPSSAAATLVPAEWKVVSNVRGMGGLRTSARRRAMPRTRLSSSSRASSSRAGSP